MPGGIQTGPFPRTRAQAPSPLPRGFPARPVSDAWQGALFALGTSLVFGTFGLFARRGQQYASAATGVLIGLFVMVPAYGAGVAIFWQSGWWNREALFYFALAGLFGPAIARICRYESIHQLGVTRAMPLAATTPLFSTIFAYILLGERPGPHIWAGTLLIAAGCAALSFRRGGEANWNRRALWIPLVGVVTVSLSFVFRKAGLVAVPSPLLGAAVASLAGLVFFTGFVRLLPASMAPDLGHRKAWYYFLLCGVLNLFGFLFQFNAIHLAGVSIAVPLVSTAPLVSLVLSGIFLRDMERVTPWIVAGTVCIVLGAGLIAFRIE